MDVGDVDGVAVLEANVFSPWSRRQIASELHRESGFSLVGVAADGAILAWCCGMWAGSDAELLKITVTPSKQRLGIGRALLQKLILLFVQQGAEQVFLEVRSQNHPALKLYSGLGWQETGRRINYYKKPVDDAIILVYRLKNQRQKEKIP